MLKLMIKRFIFGDDYCFFYRPVLRFPVRPIPLRQIPVPQLPVLQFLVLQFVVNVAIPNANGRLPLVGRAIHQPTRSLPTPTVRVHMRTFRGWHRHVLPSAPNTCRSTTARQRRYSKSSYSTCPVASGLLQRRAGRSSSFHAGTVLASPARSGTHRSGSQAA